MMLVSAEVGVECGDEDGTVEVGGFWGEGWRLDGFGLVWGTE